MTAPTDAERALEVVRRHAPRYPGYYSILAKDIAAALAAVRTDERERAARIAETFVDACDVRTAREIAAEIRAGEKR